MFIFTLVWLDKANFYSLLFFNFCLMFIYFLRQKEAEHERGRVRERETDIESEAGSRPWAVSTETDAGLKLTDHERDHDLSQSRTLNWLSHPGAPKEGNFLMSDNVDEPWGHYTKWNKSESERLTPYDFTNMWNLKAREQTPLNSQLQRTDWWLPICGR